MRLKKLYPWLFPIGMVGMLMTIWGSALPLPFSIASLLIGVALIFLGYLIAFQRRPCGHGIVTMDGIWCFPWVLRRCPECGREIY